MKILFMLLILVSCSKKPESTTAAGIEFQVDKLFTVDGCTVYRFYDVRKVYFTNCNGSASYQRSCGKNCTESVNVD